MTDSPAARPTKEDRLLVAAWLAVDEAHQQLLNATRILRAGGHDMGPIVGRLNGDLVDAQSKILPAGCWTDTINGERHFHFPDGTDGYTSIVPYVEGMGL